MSKQKKIFVGMTHVKDDYANTGLSDTEFAKLISKRTGLEFSCAEVRAYRAALEMTVNRPSDDRDQLIANLRDLSTRLYTLICSAELLMPAETARDYQEWVVEK